MALQKSDTVHFATFMDVFTRLAGQVHVLERAADARVVLDGILQQVETPQVVMAGLPADLRSVIDDCCRARDIAVEASPFHGLKLPDALDTARVGITMAAFAVAETGSVVEIARQDADRLVSSLPRVHICFLRRTSVVATLKDAAPLLREAFSPDGAVTATFISGPSRTGDIEMKLTLGVHGPEVMHVIVVD